MKHVDEMQGADKHREGAFWRAEGIMGKHGERVRSRDKDGAVRPWKEGQQGLDRLRLQGCPGKDLPKERLGLRKVWFGGLGDGGGKEVPADWRWA